MINTDILLSSPSSYRHLTYKPVDPTATHEQWGGKAVHDIFQDVNDDDYVQAKGLWDVLGRTPGQQDNYVGNVAGHLSGAHVDTRNRTYEMFSRVDSGLGSTIKTETEKLVQ